MQNLLKKAAKLDIKRICPLHGPVLDENVGKYVRLYDVWSSYTPERDGIFVAYTSVYGHTRDAALSLADKLRAEGCPHVEVRDLARSDMSECISLAFLYPKLVLATTTYNGEVFPFMRTFIEELVERGYKNRTVALIENGTWSPMAMKVMKDMLAPLKNITPAENCVTIRSALSPESSAAVDALAAELCRDYIARDDSRANKNDLKALFNIGYGLYVLTSGDEGKDNGMIINAVTQVTNTPTA